MGDKGKKNAEKLTKEKLAKKSEVQAKKGQATQRTGSAEKK
jgi:hypothetical protein